MKKPPFYAANGAEAAAAGGQRLLSPQRLLRQTGPPVSLCATCRCHNVFSYKPASAHGTSPTDPDRTFGSIVAQRAATGFMSVIYRRHYYGENHLRLGFQHISLTQLIYIPISRCCLADDDERIRTDIGRQRIRLGGYRSARMNFSTAGASSAGTGRSRNTSRSFENRTPAFTSAVRRSGSSCTLKFGSYPLKLLFFDSDRPLDAAGLRMSSAGCALYPPPISSAIEAGLVEFCLTETAETKQKIFAKTCPDETIGAACTLLKTSDTE